MGIRRIPDIRIEKEITSSEAGFAANHLGNLEPGDDLLVLIQGADGVSYARHVSLVLPLTLARDDLEEEETEFCEAFSLWMELWDGPENVRMVWERITIHFGDPSRIVLTYQQEMPVTSHALI